jgi:hypothetical protein
MLAICDYCVDDHISINHEVPKAFRAPELTERGDPSDPFYLRSHITQHDNSNTYSMFLRTFDTLVLSATMRDVIQDQKFNMVDNIPEIKVAGRTRCCNGGSV